MLGAELQELNEERLGHRKGFWPRVLNSQVGGIVLRIPKLRSDSSFLPSIF